MNKQIFKETLMNEIKNYGKKKKKMSKYLKKFFYHTLSDLIKKLYYVDDDKIKNGEVINCTIKSTKFVWKLTKGNQINTNI